MRRAHRNSREPTPSAPLCRPSMSAGPPTVLNKRSTHSSHGPRPGHQDPPRSQNQQVTKDSATDFPSWQSDFLGRYLRRAGYTWDRSRISPGTTGQPRCMHGQPPGRHDVRSGSDDRPRTNPSGKVPALLTGRPRKNRTVQYPASPPHSARPTRQWPHRGHVTTRHLYLGPAHSVTQ
jgi:hypothetical protein